MSICIEYTFTLACIIILMPKYVHENLSKTNLNGRAFATGKTLNVLRVFPKYF